LIGKCRGHQPRARHSSSTSWRFSPVSPERPRAAADALASAELAARDSAA
jgi:hypothetical protein